MDCGLSCVWLALMSWFVLFFQMLVRGAANIAESCQKLEELQLQLRMRLDRAREVASSCSLDDPGIKTQEQQICDLQMLELPPFNPHINYSHEYWRTYLQNEINISTIREATDRKNQLRQLVSQIEDLQDQHYRLNRLRNRKKNRRLATQIQKSFLCPYDRCNRIYGSDVSLNLHIKIKHNGGNKTDRQKLAQRICMAQENSQPAPPLTLNLPPGYLREYRRLYFQRDYQDRTEANVLSGLKLSNAGRVLGSQDLESQSDC